MAKIIFLGTSSSIPSETRDNASFVFTHNRALILVDCPGSPSQKLLKAGVNFKKLKEIVITHQHPDHIYGIISLIHTQGHFNRNLTIYTNKPCIKVIRHLTKLFKLNQSPYPCIKYTDVGQNKTFFTKNKLRIRAIENKHIKGSFGVKFSFAKKSLFYSSDTAFSPDMLEKAGKINYLVHDCTASTNYFKKHPSLYKMHTTSRQIANYLKDKKNLKFMPVHFLLEKKGEEKRIKKELEPIKNNLIFVKDFDRVYL